MRKRVCVTRPGDRLVAEYDPSRAPADQLLRRYVHGPGVDEPLVWYECANPPGACTSNRNWLIADRQGSIIAATPVSGAGTIYRYGPYGEPEGGVWSGSRFRYTGQIALPELRLHHYKARVYDPETGRFLQTDPVGYEDDLNLYQYVGNDPLNSVDPSGRTALVQHDDDGNVRIELRIKFTGDAVTPELAGQIESGIEQTWSGTFGQYNVTTVVTQVTTQGPVDNEIQIMSGASTSATGHEVVRNSYRAELPIADITGQPINGTIGESQDIAGHVGGHLMGLPDYHNVDQGTLEPWQQSNIMNSGATVDERNITTIIQNAPREGSNYGPNEVTHCPNGVGPNGCN